MLQRRNCEDTMLKPLPPRHVPKYIEFSLSQFWNMLATFKDSNKFCFLFKKCFFFLDFCTSSTKREFNVNMSHSNWSSQSRDWSQIQNARGERLRILLRRHVTPTQKRRAKYPKSRCINTQMLKNVMLMLTNC